MAATILFALAVHPMTSDVGLVFFVWLAVTGTAALVFEERTLIAATALKTNVSATELFGRRGRRHLRSDPGYFFEPDAYRLYRRRARQVTAVGLLAAIALLVATVVLSVDDVLDVRAAIEQAREPWWRQR